MAQILSHQEAVELNFITPLDLNRFLITYRGGQYLFHIDPLCGVVAGVSGGAVAVVLAAVAGFEEAFEG